MSIIGDIKTIAVLAAVGAIGYGGYRLYKELPNIAGDIDKGIKDVQEDFNKFIDDSKKETEDFFKDAQDQVQNLTPEPFKEANDNFNNTVADVEVATTNFIEKQIDYFNKADWSDPKTYYNATPIGQTIKAITGWSW